MLPNQLVEKCINIDGIGDFLIFSVRSVLSWVTHPVYSHPPTTFYVADAPQMHVALVFVLTGVNDPIVYKWTVVNKVRTKKHPQIEVVKLDNKIMCGTKFHNNLGKSASVQQMHCTSKMFSIRLDCNDLIFDSF